MEEEKTEKSVEKTGKNNEQETDFLNEMAYNDGQKAMFYLGRALNLIAYTQTRADHKNKPVLEKVNYNGMDSRSILKLYADLREKAKQYQGRFNTLYSTEPLLAKFDQSYAKLISQEKPMDSDEALFYLFSGYSFRFIKEEKITEEEIN